MEAIINKNCFVDDTFARDISHLVGDASYYSEVFRVKVEDPDIFETKGFECLDSSDREILRILFEEETQSHLSPMGETIYVDAEGEQEKRNKIFTPKEAIKYSRKPLVVLVENNANDGHFVEAIIRCFGTNRVIKALDDGLIEIGNSGGCTNVKNVLLGILNERQGKQKFVHHYVILDGDKRWKDDLIPGRSTLRYNIRAYGANLHELYKRAMENYMPDLAFEQVASPTQPNSCKAYLRLAEEQKDFYCISDGFLKDSLKYKADVSKQQVKPNLLVYRHDVPDEVQQLYFNVPDEDWEILAFGIKVPHFKDEYPKGFDDNTLVTRQYMEQRIQHQPNPYELQQIADEINNLL